MKFFRVPYELVRKPFILKMKKTVQERVRETTGEWRCAQSARGGLSEQGSSGERVQVDQATGEVTQGVNQHG